VSRRGAGHSGLHDRDGRRGFRGAAAEPPDRDSALLPGKIKIAGDPVLATRLSSLIGVAKAERRRDIVSVRDAHPRPGRQRARASATPAAPDGSAPARSCSLALDEEEHGCGHSQRAADSKCDVRAEALAIHCARRSRSASTSRRERPSSVGASSPHCRRGRRSSTRRDSGPGRGGQTDPYGERADRSRCSDPRSSAGRARAAQPASRAAAPRGSTFDDGGELKCARWVAA